MGEDNNPILDADGNQLVTKGLKTIWIERTKSTANGLLTVLDWCNKKSEKNTGIPSDTYRDNVRTACNTIETQLLIVQT